MVIQMKKLVPLIIVIVLLLSVVNVFAAGDVALQSADALYELGLFKGTGVKADGTPEYSLDKIPTRQEAVTMLVRLLGKETEATKQTWDTPFTDVDDWAKPYVGYAYNKGLTNGIAADKFGSSNHATETQYLSFVLRSLGYSDNAGDFAWDKARTLTDSIGITDPKDNSSLFDRGSVAEVSLNALATSIKDSKQTLSEKLIADGAITKDAYEKVKAKTANKPGADEYYDSLYTYAWDSSKNGYVITGFSGSTVKDLVFPEEHDGKPVVAVKRGAFPIDFVYYPESIYIPKSITELGDSQYVGFLPDKIVSITVDSDNPAYKVVDGWLLTNDGKAAVSICGGLTGTYTIPDGVEKTLAGVQHVSADRIVFPASLKEYHRIENSNFVEFVVSEDNPYFCSVDGVLMSKDEKRLIQFPCRKTGKEYTIPASVDKIADFAFRSSSIDKVIIPSTVKYIGEYAFNLFGGTIHVQGKTTGWDIKWNQGLLNTTTFSFDDDLSFNTAEYVDDTSDADGFVLNNLELAYSEQHDCYVVRINYSTTYDRYVNFFNAGRDDASEGYGEGFMLYASESKKLVVIPTEVWNTYSKFVFRVRNLGEGGYTYKEHNYIYFNANGTGQVISAGSPKIVENSKIDIGEIDNYLYSLNPVDVSDGDYGKHLCWDISMYKALIDYFDSMSDKFMTVEGEWKSSGGDATINIARVEIIDDSRGRSYHVAELHDNGDARGKNYWVNLSYRSDED